MKSLLIATSFITLLAAAPTFGQPSAEQTSRTSPSSRTSAKPPADTTASPDEGVLFRSEAVGSEGQVSVEGQPVAYHAVAGTIVVHPKGWDDAAAREKEGDKDAKGLGDKDNPNAEASIFYVAYFKKGVPSPDRPITFLYNGGPGSSSVWLHMGAFGPRRIITTDDSHTPAAPYQLLNNAYSLLDATDLVFIDAPGTGFSRIAGKDKEKSFYGVDADAYAFSQFIKGFLSKYGRWDSPKYLFGESYGTPRSAVVVNELETGDDIDFNGVILLSQILNFGLSADHNKIAGGRPADLEAYLRKVEQFANGDYLFTLQSGSELDPARRQQIAERYAHYTGLPVAYVLKADLRVNGGMFEKMLQDEAGLTTGRLDTRFSGPSMDPLSKEADYDPQSAAISSAYVSSFNAYVRNVLHYGDGRTYKPEIDVFKDWDNSHQPPNAEYAPRGVENVMPDLASAMKYNPQLKVMVNGGYFDLATPFYEGWYEDHHLQIPQGLTGNIEYRYYPSCHMVYAHEESLKALHDNVAAFIRRTDNLSR